MKLSKTKKIILLGASIGILTTIVVPIIVLNQKNDEKNQNEKDISNQDEKDVSKVIKILEEKNDKTIILPSDSTGKIIANNQKEIIEKIKKLIGETNLKGIKVEISLQQDKEISTNFEKIVVKISKGNYSQTLKNDKTISVKRSKTVSEIALTKLNQVKTSLEALAIKVVQVDTTSAVDHKIITNKVTILEEITKLNGYSNLDLKDINIKVKDSETFLPAIDQDPIPITLVLSKDGNKIEVSGFKAKALSSQEILENIQTVNLVKSSLESLNQKIVDVYTRGAIDKKIKNNKTEILNSIERINGYLEIDFQGSTIEVKNSENVLPENNQSPIAITLVVSKSGVFVEVNVFSAKQMSTSQETANFEIKQIKNKITNKDVLIPKNVNTFSDLEILSGIKNQLKINNPTLNDQDLEKINDDVWHLKPGKKTSVTLKIELENIFEKVNINVTKEKDIKLWTKNSAIVTNSNIDDGRHSSFIQDSSGNFWAMGGEFARKGRFGHNPTKLQVLKRDGTQWEEDTNNGLTKGSNIVNGNKGVIFEDDFGNIWSMGTGTKLQVLVKNKDGSYANSWVDDNGEDGEKLLQGSLISNGENGTIFQDDFGNLWAMAKGSKLQVLVKNKDGSYASSWDTNNDENGKLLKGSKITNGEGRIIFQDSFGNLWAMAKGSKLQVLVKNKDGSYASSWDTNNDENGKLLKNSNITNGEDGTIFQDSFGNLWTIAKRSKLQVLRANQNGYDKKTGWTSANSGLTKGSNIINSWDGTIFQDSFGNLWTQGYSRKPQVLRVNQIGDDYVSTGWVNDNTQGLLNNLQTHKSHEILNSAWVFFQDSFKNLWAMGNQVSLQVLRANQAGDGYVNSWENDVSVPGLLKDSNIINGQRGTIFEDSSKNLWSMGWSSGKLQVYDKTQEKWIS